MSTPKDRSALDSEGADKGHVILLAISFMLHSAQNQPENNLIFDPRVRNPDLHSLVCPFPVCSQHWLPQAVGLARPLQTLPFIP